MPTPTTCEPGDLVYIKLPNGLGRAVEEITHSPVSHVGIVARDATGDLTVVHALDQVREEPLADYMQRGLGHFAVERFPFNHDADRESFIAAARALLGKPYDFDFAMTNDAIYCAELVYRAFMDGPGLEPIPLHPLFFGDPGTRGRHMMERITHGHVPDGVPGVTPADYFTAPGFKLVDEHLGD